MDQKKSGDANAAEGTSDDDGIFAPSDDGETWMAAADAAANAVWLLDSGASHHITGQGHELINTKPCELHVTVADGRVITATTKGDLPLIIERDGSQRRIVLQDVHHIPGLRKNLMSVSQLARRGIATRFDTRGATLARGGADIGSATWQHGLCLFNGRTAYRVEANVAMKTNDTLMGWHARMGHLNLDDVVRADNHNVVDGVHITDRVRLHCDAWREAKQNKSTKAIADTSTSAPTDEVGAVIGIDIKTCVKPTDIYGNRHSLQIVDHATSYSEGFPMKTRAEWFPIVTGFILRLERQHAVTVKVIRSDNEFATTEMENWCAERGIRQQLSEAAESSSNGKVERQHRTMFDGMRASLFDAPPAPSNAVVRGTPAPRVVAESVANTQQRCAHNAMGGTHRQET
ncbi:TPA: hypothetical protein N0F65_010969 [Lagenidium giganteum]|uniref:Integrase catalytic domain-containing protein n=1 Tax=Lagenidium giganteum TaxID=4803 RepID=A0AAV2Z709_9STRA|nr:TPA: hypothetical protein N0F65_010969 [Lagenidium giganteum]